MKIGVLSLNFTYHGEASAAIRWSRALNLIGHDAELFTFSKSGKKLKAMREDYPFTCIKSVDEDSAKRFLDSKDIIISYGTGKLGEDEGFPPPYYDCLESMDTPLVTYFPLGLPLTKSYKNTDMFLQLPTFVGCLFLRDTIRKFYYEDYEYKSLVAGKPYRVLNHPFEAISTLPVTREGNVFLSTTRISPAKRINKLLKAVLHSDLMSHPSFELKVYGDTGASRYGYLLEQEFGKDFEKVYYGPYTHNQLESVYQDGRYAIDLTSFTNDGGVQHLFMESIDNGALPIVVKGWNVRGIAMEAESSDPEDVYSAIVKAISYPEELRVSRVMEGKEYLREEHNPLVQAGKLAAYLETLV